MQCGLCGKFAGIVRMVPAAAEAAPAAREKNFAANKIFRKLVLFMRALASFLHLHSRQGCNILLIGV